MKVVAFLFFVVLLLFQFCRDQSLKTKSRSGDTNSAPAKNRLNDTPPGNASSGTGTTVSGNSGASPEALGPDGNPVNGEGTSNGANASNTRDPRDQNTKEPEEKNTDVASGPAISGTDSGAQSGFGDQGSEKEKDNASGLSSPDDASHMSPEQISKLDAASGKFDDQGSPLYNRMRGKDDVASGPEKPGTPGKGLDTGSP